MHRRPTVTYAKHLVYALAAVAFCWPAWGWPVDGGAAVRPAAVAGTPAPADDCTGKQDQPLTPSIYDQCLAPAADPPAAGSADGAVHDACAAAARTPGPAASPACDKPPPDPQSLPNMKFITLAPVPFEFNKVDLNDAATHILDRTVDYLHRQSNVRRLLIYGHADVVGTSAYNYTLSEKRTEAIVSYLVSRGISSGIIYSSAKGDTVPIDEYWTPEGRKHNRRVEIYAVLR